MKTYSEYEQMSTGPFYEKKIETFVIFMRAFVREIRVCYQVDAFRRTYVTQYIHILIHMVFRHRCNLGRIRLHMYTIFGYV